MKRIVVILLLSTLTSAVIVPNQTFEKVEIENNSNTEKDNSEISFIYKEGMNPNDLEIKLGRKMSLFEKVSFFLNKRRTAENIFGKPEQKKGISGLTIAGFTSAVVGLFFLPALFSTAGLVLSAISMVQSKKHNQEGRGLAIAGFIAGIAGVAFLIVSLITLI